MTMLDLNLFSQMGLLVLGGPMLLMGLASFGVAGIAYGVRDGSVISRLVGGAGPSDGVPGHAADAGRRRHRRSGVTGIDGVAVIVVHPRGYLR